MGIRAVRTRRWAAQWDARLFAGAAALPTAPQLDRAVARLSAAADRSKLSVAVAAGVAVLGGPAGRRDAVVALSAVAATSAVVNLGLKPLQRRARPDRAVHAVPVGRQVPVPRSPSFPSGHTASAFAFAAAMGARRPALRVPLCALAAAVGWSRVHVGVHYPSDVLAGALVGHAVGALVVRTAGPVPRPAR
jgi:undecaprenyl-diphosphatase